MRAIRTLPPIVLVLLLASAVALAAIAVGASDAPPPGIPEAAAKLRAGAAGEAAKILEGVVAREPKNARAWRMLGLASLQAKNLERARASYEKVLSLEPEQPQALYNLGVVHALRGEKDDAFRFLGRARATRKIDMSFAAVDDDLASLRGDPRLAAILPTARDFENSFVEPVKVLREWDGEGVNDQFGWIARDAGDVDGDGVHDVVTSAPTRAAGGEKAGRIYLYSTRSGKLLWSADGRAADELGTGVEGAGDTDGDGVPDVVAGAPGGGRAYIYSGRDGRVLREFHGEKDDQYGRHVSGVGDVDGDGTADVIVGAPGKGAGRAELYSGKTGRLLATFSGEREGDAFGSTVGGATGRTGVLVIVGAPKAGPHRTGRTYVYDRLGGSPRFVIESDGTGNALGAMFVSVLGDVDGDGRPDVYASDWSNGANGPSTGRVYVHSGADGRRLLTLTGDTAGEGFGIGPATAGDVDGDGHADLVIGAWQYGEAAVSGGRVSLFSGKDGRRLATYTCRVPGDTFGFDAVGLGDVDGDGVIDLLVTSAWSGVHGYHSGRVFVISSGVSRISR